MVGNKIDIDDKRIISKEEGNKLISGYYGLNTLYDAYFEIDDNNRDINIFEHSTYKILLKYWKKI